ncbi:MAG: hypothetical protein QY311_00075 [Candidatus Paceibacterota bacterium]|nr:MAG: hypothetical protein QY311_00075 [Candidatus Paceibacterota bacterium]
MKKLLRRLSQIPRSLIATFCYTVLFAAVTVSWKPEDFKSALHGLALFSFVLLAFCLSLFREVEEQLFFAKKLLFGMGYYEIQAGLEKRAKELDEAYRQIIVIQRGGVGLDMKAPAELEKDPERMAKWYADCHAAWVHKAQAEAAEAKETFWGVMKLVADFRGQPLPKSYKDLLPPKNAVPAYDPD